MTNENTRALFTMLALLSATATSACKMQSGPASGSSTSIIASVPSISGLANSSLVYQLLCDPNQANLVPSPPTAPSTNVVGVISGSGATQTATSTGATKAKAGDTCLMQVAYSGTDVTKDSNYSHWQWTSVQKTPGLFYSSNLAQLQAAGNSLSLALTLYQTYVDTSNYLALAITVTLPTGVTTTGASANGGSISCDNKRGGTSTSATPTATSQQIVYVFSVSPDTVTAGTKCDFTSQLAAGGPTYSAKGAFTAVDKQLAYSATLALDVVATNGQINVNSTTTTCPSGQSVDLVSHQCTAPAAPAPVAVQTPAPTPQQSPAQSSPPSPPTSDPSATQTSD